MFCSLQISFLLEFEEKAVSAESLREGSNHRYVVKARVLQLLPAHCFPEVEGAVK